MKGMKLKDKIGKRKEWNMVPEIARLALSTGRVWKCQEKKKVNFDANTKVKRRSWYLPISIKNKLANISPSTNTASLISVIKGQQKL